jgi:hypothetical protein
VKGYFLAAVLLVGCTEASLFGERSPTTADIAAFKGNICTSDPTERAFPVRALFIVDTTIDDADYISQRADSIEKLISTFSGPNYSYGVIRYSGLLKGTTCGLRNLTPNGFEKGVEEAVAGLRCADLGNPQRNLIDALSLASSFVTGDVLASDLGIRSRTKYVVVLLSNGPPNVSLPRLWCNSRNPPIEPADCGDEYFEAFCSDAKPPPADCERYQYVRLVKEMKSFVIENGAQEFFFHSVYQRDPSQSQANQDDQGAIDLLSELALAGGGSTYRFPRSARCNPSGGDSAGCLFSAINLETTESVFQRKQIIVSNRSALATPRGLRPDTDQDGLTDEEEDQLGTAADFADTDGDLLSDRVEHLLSAVGLDPLAHQDDLGAWPLECPRPGSPSLDAFPPDQDRDGDRLTDCEEILLKSDPTLFDTDADGVPDPVELRLGTNLLADDGLRDTDNDGLANIDEHRLHLDPLARDPNTDRAYVYELANEEKREVFAFTQPFVVTGVTILEVGSGSNEGRASIYYEPPPNPDQPVTAENPGSLAWRDPLDTTPSGTTPGRGTPVPITGDGRYVLHSAQSTPDLATGPQSVTVDVAAYLLPRDTIRADVRLRMTERFCFDFRVDNVRLVPTRLLPDTGRPGLNYIDVFLSEVPANNPKTFGVFRVATIPLEYPADPKARAIREPIELIDQDFLLFGE